MNDRAVPWHFRPGTFLTVFSLFEVSGIPPVQSVRDAPGPYQITTHPLSRKIAFLGASKSHANHSIYLPWAISPGNEKVNNHPHFWREKSRKTGIYAPYSAPAMRFRLSVTGAIASIPRRYRKERFSAKTPLVLGEHADALGKTVLRRDFRRT